MVSWASSTGQANTIAIERHGKRTRFVHRIHGCEKYFLGRWMKTWELPKGMKRSKLNSLPHRGRIEERVISYGEALAHAEAHGELDGMKYRLGLLAWTPAPEHRKQQSAAFITSFIYHDCVSAEKHDGTGRAVFHAGNGAN